MKPVQGPTQIRRENGGRIARPPFASYPFLDHRTIAEIDAIARRVR